MYMEWLPVIKPVIVYIVAWLRNSVVGVIKLFFSHSFFKFYLLLFPRRLFHSPTPSSLFLFDIYYFSFSMF